jgi:hypothetical protein
MSACTAHSLSDWTCSLNVNKQSICSSAPTLTRLVSSSVGTQNKHYEPACRWQRKGPYQLHVLYCIVLYSVPKLGKMRLCQPFLTHWMD